MNIGRRELALAGAAVLGAVSLLRSTAAVAADEDAVAQAVETLRKAIFDKNRADLEKLTVDQLSYGHSSAVVQSKAEFIDGVVNRKATVKSLAFPDLKVTMAGSNAIARHRWISDSETDGKAEHTEIGVLGVWTQQAGAWRLLARQGFKLPT
jgi:hypothetical protein